MRSDPNERLEIRLTRLEERIEGMKAALDIARMEMDRRLHELNDVRMRFVSRDFYDRGHEDVMNRIGALENSKAFAGGGLWAYGTVVGIMLGVADLLLHFFNK